MSRDPVNRHVIAIAPETILLIIFALVSVFLLIEFLARVETVILVFLAALVLAQAVDPLVGVLERIRLSRLFAAIVAYLIVIEILLGISAFVVPELLLQLRALILNLPSVVTQIQRFLSTHYALSQLGLSTQVQTLVSQLTSNLAQSLPALLLLPFVVGSIVFYGLMTIVISFYWLLASKRVNALVINAFPSAMRDEAAEVVDGMGARVGGWVRAQIFLSLSLGVLTFIGLLLLGVPFAVVLAVWTAITELIPIVGPILGAIPALIIAFINSPLQALFVLILYLIVQQIENHILVPNIMSHEIGLHPLLVIMALLMGAELMGIMGALIAIPLASALEVLLIHVARRFAPQD